MRSLSISAHPLEEVTTDWRSHSNVMPWLAVYAMWILEFHPFPSKLSRYPSIAHESRSRQSIAFRLSDDEKAKATRCIWTSMSGMKNRTNQANHMRDGCGCTIASYNLIAIDLDGIASLRMRMLRLGKTLVVLIALKFAHDPY